MMATQRIGGVSQVSQPGWMLTRVATFPRLRALAWSGDMLFASRGYELLRARMTAAEVEWERIGKYQPEWWRNLSSASKLGSRLFRDGFHALTVLSSGHVVAAVPKAIITLAPGEHEFQLSHRVSRGTRPLHLAIAPEGHVFWGEYFDNPSRDEVHIYASTDRGASWNVAYTFPKGEIRHVHNIVYDEFENCLWVLTGDQGAECRILRVSYDFKNVDVVLSGNQQARAVALVPTREGLYFSSDTPLETNHVYRLDRRGNLERLANLPSSSIYGCLAGSGVFFSSMAEPSTVNSEHDIHVYGSHDGEHWHDLLQWKKDGWPMSFFQYGNAFLPDGRNTNGLLAVTTIAVKAADLETSVWRVDPS